MTARSRTFSASGKSTLCAPDIKVLTFNSGKISDFNVTSEGETKSADVTFEKETAAKTALLLNNTQLGTNHIAVTSAGGHNDDGSHFTQNANRDTDEITQEEKPRARIIAVSDLVAFPQTTPYRHLKQEYLAAGYVVGDAAIQRAIDIDSTHGVSSRFLNTIHSLDQKYHATDRAKATDQNYGLSMRANNFLTGLSTYFEKATNTPTGKKIVKFYEEGQKQVAEVHAEARRLADLKTEEHGGSAYKASGLEKVFGKEKAAEPTAGSSQSSVDQTVPTMTTQIPTDEKTRLG